MHTHDTQLLWIQTLALFITGNDSFVQNFNFVTNKSTMVQGKGEVKPIFTVNGQTDPDMVEPNSKIGPPLVMVQRSKSQWSNTSICIFTIVSTFLAIGAIFLTLHLTGVTKKSYAIPFRGDGTLNGPLRCECRNLDSCPIMERSVLNCELGEICAMSVDRGGRVVKGCMKDRGNVCEYVHMGDYEIIKPEFSPGEVNHKGKRRSVHQHGSRRVRSQMDYFHFCYCRSSGCNQQQNDCKCHKNGK